MKFIIDDEGCRWFLKAGRIRCWEAEQAGEWHPDENGYPAKNWQDAIKLLNEYGYIDCSFKDSRWIEMGV